MKNFTKMFLTACLITGFAFSLNAQSVGINADGSAPNSSAGLDVNFTNKGFLPPRMTTAQRNAIPSPVEGLVIYNRDEKVLNIYTGTSWDYANPFVCGQPLSDPRDGKVYNTVLIGTQCWMKENLNVGTKVDANGSYIMQTDNDIIEKYCYNNDPANCTTYGGLYTWDEMMQYSTTPGVQGICPTGWHLPTDAEWTTLTTYVSSQPAFYCGYYYNAKALAATTLWFTSTGTCTPGNDLAANNATGFTGLPVGCSTMNAWNYLTSAGYWWSSSFFDASTAYYRRIFYGNADVGRPFDDNRLNGFTMSVRCLKAY